MQSTTPELKRPKPTYFYHTPFSYIAFWLVLLMIVPLPGRITPVRDARAQVADGVCEICIPVSGITCPETPADPDCTPIVVTPTLGLCPCKDGTVVPTQNADPSVAECNTSNTCLNHGGSCGDLSCFIPPGEGFALADVEFFNSDTIPLAVYAFDPDTNALVLNQAVNALMPLGNLEFRAVTEVLTAHGLPATVAERNLVKTWARDRVRAQMMTDFVNIIVKGAAARTGEENVLYDWLTYLVWKKRILTAQFAWEQYVSWKYAVDYAKCDWQSPTRSIAIPIGLDSNGKFIYSNPPLLIGGIYTLTAKPNCTPGPGLDGRSGTRDDETCFFQKQTPGCSPGIDGIPGTDPVPNSGSIEDALGLRDDGETCFAFPKANTFQATTPPLDDNETMSYDAITQSRCAGANPLFDVGLAAHPPIEDFLRYGLALARKNEVITPGFVSVLGNTYKEEAFGIGLGVAGLAAAGTGAAVYRAGGWTTYTTKIAPYIGRAAKIAKDASAAALKTAGQAAQAAARLASTIAAATIVLEVVGNIVTAVLTLLDIIEFNDVPIKLKAVVRAAYGATETTVTISENYRFTTGKPNLQTLILTDAGKDEIRFALVEAMAPEKDLSGATAPEPDPNQFWAQTQVNTGVRKDSSPLTHSLFLTAWDGSKPFEKQVIGLYGNGWFTTQVTHPDGTVTKGLELGLDYKDCNGKERRVWRVDNDEFVTVPMGATAADFDLTKTTKTKEFQYLSYDQTLGCLTARINHAPTATGLTITSSGTPTEGQSSTFTGITSDPDNDTVNLTWNFGDGTSSATGSPVDHTFADSGSLQVVMKSTDVFGLPGTTKTQSITVENVAPTATLGNSGSVNEGSSATLSFSGASDPSSVDTLAGFHYAFDCNGGSLATATFAGSGTSNSISCPFADSPSSTVKGKIMDKDNGGREYTTTVTVNNVAPTATFTATPQIFQGESVKLEFKQPFDPSPADTTTGFTYAYSCPSGTVSVPSNLATVRCKYLTTGTFTVGGIIRDKDNGANSYTATVAVISPQQAATNLKSQVVALNLDAMRTSDLTTKIDNALQQLALGQKSLASKQLQDFIKKVNDIVRQKLITAAQGQALIDTANRIIASIAVS